MNVFEVKQVPQTHGTGLKMSRCPVCKKIAARPAARPPVKGKIRRGDVWMECFCCGEKFRCHFGGFHDKFRRRPLHRPRHRGR
ncbi:MAG: hypothetical protein WC107_07280 [Patescibacteria group bacterium]